MTVDGSNTAGDRSAWLATLATPCPVHDHPPGTACWTVGAVAVCNVRARRAGMVGAINLNPRHPRPDRQESPDDAR